MAHREVDIQNIGEGGHANELLLPTKEEEVFITEVGGLFSQPGDDSDSPLYEVDPAFAPQNCKPGVLICLLCSFDSPNPNTLKRHVCNHLKKQRFDLEKKQLMIMCLACGFENENNYVMAGHLRTHDKLVHSYMSLANKRTRVMGETRLSLPNYQCLLCEFNGNSATEIILHVKENHQSEDFVCKVCNLDCRSLNGFLEHKNEHEVEKTVSSSTRSLIKNGDDNALSCPLCSFRSSSMMETLSHVETHNNVDVITCPSCNCRFHSSASLKEHAPIHEEGGTCTKCSAVNINLSSFEGVVFCDSTVDPRRFHCTMCEFSTTRASSMTRHLQRHMLPTTFKCNHCSFSSHQKSDVNAHKAICHKAPVEPPPETITYEWWCSDCNSVFSTGGELNDHVRNVHRIPYENGNEQEAPILVSNEQDLTSTCRQCGHQSSSIEEDKQHFIECRQKKKIRYVSKPYTPRGVFYCCMECDFQTKKVSSLKHHMTSHENSPRYLCSRCSRSFRTEDDYKVHESLMHKDHKLVCGECGIPLDVAEVAGHYSTNHPKIPTELVDPLGDNPLTRREPDGMDEEVVLVSVKMNSKNKIYV